MKIDSFRIEIILLVFLLFSKRAANSLNCKFDDTLSVDFRSCGNHKPIKQRVSRVARTICTLHHFCLSVCLCVCLSVCLSVCCLGGLWCPSGGLALGCPSRWRSGCGGFVSWLLGLVAGLGVVVGLGAAGLAVFPRGPPLGDFPCGPESSSRPTCQPGGRCLTIHQVECRRRSTEQPHLIFVQSSAESFEPRVRRSSLTPLKL